MMDVISNSSESIATRALNMRPHLSLTLVLLPLVLGCTPSGSGNDSPHLQVDVNGFVLNRGATPRLVVGAGDSGETVIRNNRYLENKIWLPKPSQNNVFDEMRLALMAETDVQYNDGDVTLNVCAHSVNVDGSDAFKYGVGFVGIKLCNSPINDYKRALELAKAVVVQLEKNNPDISNLGDFYRSASQQELTALGGNIWKDIAIKSFKDSPAPRDNPERSYLFTFEEAETYFSNKLQHPEYEIDVNGKPRLLGGHALLAVYAGKRAIFELGIYSTTRWGGTNLSQAQLDEQRYDVFMHFRLRNDFDARTLTNAASAFRQTSNNKRRGALEQT